MPLAALLPLLAAATTLDLSPVFAGEDARAARSGVSNLRQGRSAEAVRDLQGVEGPHAAFLRARALLGAGRPAGAVRALEGLEAALPELSDRILALRGEALEAAGRPREALDAWAAVPDGSPWAAEARLSLARGAQALGERDRALAALAPLLERPAPDQAGAPDPGAAALLLAGRLRAAGKGADPAAARRDLLACWSAHALAPEAPACLQAARALPGPHGAAPEPALSLARAERLLEANRTADARRALAGLEVGPPSAEDAFACRVRAVLGRAHRREREHLQVLAVLGPVVERCTEPAVVARATYVLAGSTAITGDAEGAIALHRRLAGQFPANPLADDALYAVADLLAAMGRPDEARAALAELVAGHPAGDRRDEARFRAAWLTWRGEDPAGAIAQLAAIEATELGVDPYEHARAAYWRARLLAGRGEPGIAAARAVWAELVARYPADYYGLLSRSRLSGDAGVGSFPEPLGAVSVEPAWSPGPLAEDPRFAAGVVLLRMGLEEDAAVELGAVDLGRLAGGGPEPLLVLADLLDRAGDHRAAHHLLRTQARVALPRAPRPEDLRAWHLAYPPAFRDLVKRHAPASGLPVDLVQALMREESALDPNALSPAGAIGLTQLMLPTARQVARQAGWPRPGKADLMRPETNIQIGSRYLGQLVRRFDGSIVLGLAAYNAGPTPVNRWLAAAGEEDLDAFVEEIPYDETRAYVKRVLRSYAAYRLLHGAADGPPASGPAPAGTRSAAGLGPLRRSRG